MPWRLMNAAKSASEQEKPASMFYKEQPSLAYTSARAGPPEADLRYGAQILGAGG